MENLKNNFEELKNLLLAAVDILEKTNCVLEERVAALEKEVEVLGKKIDLLENNTSDSHTVMGVVPEKLETDAPEVSEAEELEIEDIKDIKSEEDDYILEVIIDDEDDEDAGSEYEDEDNEDAESEEDEKSEDGDDVVQSNEEVGEKDVVEIVAEEKDSIAGLDGDVEEGEAVETGEKEGENSKSGRLGRLVGRFFSKSKMQQAEDEDSCEEQVEENSCEVEKTDYEEGGENRLSGEGVEEEEEVEEQEQEQPDWFDWEVDYPAEYIEDIYEGINLNDRYEFVRELFNVTGNLGEAEIIFKETLDDINGMDSFKEVVAYIRNRFPQWDEQSDEVYRFYMIARRRFNK